MCSNDCKQKKSASPQRDAGLWSGLLLLLVPKCPFCFMAFSSVLVFCGEKDAGLHSRNFYSLTTLILTAVFCVTALVSIILYYRPGQGRYALAMAIPGILAIIFSVTMAGGITLYYSGALLVLSGLVRNSGLWSFSEKIFFTKKQVY